ncbi:hypothetical protein [Prosthecobacter sp.]|uniref:hypothetical protein n=1 Tax=Prosthecobacter sp. TaxID=1965333 RepID=UPI00378365F3
MTTALKHLQWALQALASPAEVQLRLHPPFVSILDELVLDFDCWFHVAASETEFTLEQQAALSALEKCIVEWSGPPHADVWMEAALKSHPVWFDFRMLAAEALVALGWPVEHPPIDPAVRGTTFLQASFDPAR